MKAQRVSAGLYRVNNAILVQAENASDAICQVIKAMINNRRARNA